jgi:hypothetical protein
VGSSYGDLREVQLQFTARRDFGIDYNERCISIGREIWSSGSSTMIKHFRRVATRYGKLAVGLLRRASALPPAIQRLRTRRDASELRAVGVPSVIVLVGSARRWLGMKLLIQAIRQRGSSLSR